MSFAHLEIIASNLQTHEHQAGVRKSTLDGAVEEFKRTMQRLGLAEDKLSRCSCGAGERGFEINTRNRPVDAHLDLRHMKDRREQDKLNGWADVFAEVEALRKAGVRGAL